MQYDEVDERVGIRAKVSGVDVGQGLHLGETGQELTTLAKCPKLNWNQNMIERLDYVSINAPAIASMAKAKNAMPSIDEKLRALIELRVSQINGCAYCVDLHTTQARAAGETQQRLDCLTVWKDGAFFDDKEKAAFAWAEAVTLVSVCGAPKPLFDALSDYFSDTEIVDLTLIIAQMNAWNRVAISFGHLPEPRIE